MGGSSYGTGGYQSYLAFGLTGTRRIPRVEYDFFGEQNFSVYQDHPVEPEGPYSFSVKMPYTPDGMRIDGNLIQPVWYSDSAWNIRSSAQTPVGDENSPQFVIVRSPFSMVGRTLVYGSASVNTRVLGFGTAELTFENIDGRYFLYEARYNFGD